MTGAAQQPEHTLHEFSFNRQKPQPRPPSPVFTPDATTGFQRRLPRTLLYSSQHSPHRPESIDVISNRKPADGFASLADPSRTWIRHETQGHRSRSSRPPSREERGSMTAAERVSPLILSDGPRLRSREGELRRCWIRRGDQRVSRNARTAGTWIPFCVPSHLEPR